MPLQDEPIRCEGCGTEVDPTDATRRRTIGDLDPEKWQTLCCPDCGRRLHTAFVGDVPDRDGGG